MKTAVRIYKWIIISILTQIVILSFFNYIYLNWQGEVRITSTEVSDMPKVDMKVKISKEAYDLKVSYDGAYASYIIGKKLEIFDITRKDAKKSIDPGDKSLTYYRWLPDRHMVIYALKSVDAQGGSVQITTYDIDSGTERSYPVISKLPKQSEVVEIELSPLTNIVYVKVKTSDSQAVIYKYNIMDVLSYVMNTGARTVIKETNYSDKLVYQDEKNKLYIRDGIKNSTLPVSFKSKVALLEIASEDKIYVGELDKENKVNKILFGKPASDANKSWEQVGLKKPVLPDDIVITPDDTIYEVVKEENAVYDVTNDKKVELSGKFIGIIDGYIVTLSNGELRLSVIK